MDRAALILEEALADMKSRQGVSLGDLTAAEAAELVHAVDRVANPYAEVNADAAGIPVRVAPGVWFWHLSVGASVWLDEVQKMLPKGAEDRLYKFCLIYACGNARTRGAFPPIESPDVLETLVKGYFRGLACTIDEVNAALDVIFSRKDPETDRNEMPEAASWASICARLEAQTGVPADEWMWQRSGKYLIRCYRDLHTFAEAYAKDGERRHATDELDEAVVALQELKLAIMRRVKGNG